MKIKKRIQGFIDIFNSELQKFVSKDPDVNFNEIKNTDEDYTEGSLSYKDFTVFFRCHRNRIGYGFMEEPFGQETDVENVSATFEARFKFNFSQILFSVYDIHNLVNDNNFRTLCFHNITNEEAAVNAIESILDFIKRNIKTISYIDKDESLQERLITNYLEDERVLNKKFNETEFNNNIKENVELHETLMGWHFSIESGVYKFLTTGNYKTLVNQFNKAEKKNRLIVFEKRYQKHLYSTSFEKSNKEIANKLINKQKRATATCLFYLCMFIVSAVTSIALETWATEFSVNHFHPDTLFIGFTSRSFLEIIGLTFAPFFLLTTLTLKISRLKQKVNRLIFKEKFDRTVITISLFLIIISVLMTVNTYKNHGIYIENNNIYIDNAEIISENEKPEFIYIKGYKYEELNGTTVYSTEPEYRELYYIFNGDYESYTLCEFCNNGDSYVTNDILNQIKRAGCKIITYDTIEDYAEANDFVISE